MKQPLVVIVGPTSSGKSDLALRIAREHNGEIICADSRTVYKGMDIGTAKPSKEEQSEIRHHLLDVVEPDQPFSAARFKQLANQAIEDISRRGKLPIMVGGTGLYVDAVIFDYQFGEQADSSERERLQQLSVPELQRICSDKNIEMPFNAANKRHLIRAIELGGLPKRTTVLRSHTIVVGISTEKIILEKRITSRVHAMIAAGILHETKELGERYGWQTEAMTGNIYRVFHEVLQGTLSEEEAIEVVSRSDLRLAKRQMTWFRRNPHIIWGDSAELEGRINSFLAVVKR
jgi:tRNA dimethylallyltransferase